MKILSAVNFCESSAHPELTAGSGRFLWGLVLEFHLSHLYFYVHLSLSQVASVPDSREREVHPMSSAGQVVIPAWSVKGCI